MFIKMNTSASPLKDFDIVVAQLEGAVGSSLHEMISNLEQAVPATSNFNKIEDLALAVGALLLGKPPLKKTYLELDFGKGFSSVWENVVSGIDRGISFLRDERIFGEKLLPTEVALYLVSALWAKVPIHGYDEEGRARSIIRKALWRACYTDRYLKTAATRAYADYKGISALIADKNSKENIDLFNEEYSRLPTVEEIARAGWPSRKDRLGRAILATSLHRGGFDFADGAPIGVHNVKAREYHHLFPAGALGIERDDPFVTRAANCAFITWRTNRKISAKTPKEYIEARAKEAELGEKDVRQRLESHMVPFDELVSGNYEIFIQRRSQEIYDAMQILCKGGNFS